MNSATEQEHATIEEVVASNTIGEVIEIHDNTIAELKEKVGNLSKENLELNERIMVTQMFYDGFRDDMREKFGYDSDEDDERNYQALPGIGKRKIHM